MSPRNIILLTGAGFSKNFGGFLGEEVLHEIYNNQKVQASQPLRHFLIETLDYEYIYQKALDCIPPFNASDRSAMIDAVKSAYELQEKMYVPIDGRKLGDMCRFLDKHVEIFFTLNHDLFIEKYFMSSISRELTFPPFVSDSSYAKQMQRLPSEEKLNQQKDVIESALKDGNALNYIKLHGSINWIDSKTGEVCVIVGGNKEEKMKKEPLLNYFLDIFTGHLLSGKKKLIVIGYGFMDAHINEAILKALETYSLDLHIIEKMSLKDFRDNMRGTLRWSGPVVNLPKEAIELRETRIKLIRNPFEYHRIQSLNDYFTKDGITQNFINLLNKLGISETSFNQ